VKFVTKEFIGMTVLLVLVFLVLTHASGFARDLGAATQFYTGSVKALQGR
jgi:hypothetical protein